MKLICKECSTVFDAAEKETLEKLQADHNARYHDNKMELVKKFAADAKSMAFKFAHGTVPTRKQAKVIVETASQILNEPIPEMPEDEKAPASSTATESGNSSAGTGEGATVAAGDSSKGGKKTAK